VPRISIVLPTYNGARYIRECIDSCLSQTFRDIELIVVVDGSTDNTEEILKAYDDRRMKVIKTMNQGQAPAMNTGFAVASGEYWSWTSDDNIYVPDAFEVMARYLDAHPEAAAVATDCLIIDENGKIVGYEEYPWQCFLYRAEMGRKVGPHRPEARIIEDIDFFLRFRHLGGPVMRISAPYYHYRVHSNAVTPTRAAERPLISLKLTYDLASRGIVEVDLRELFLNRMSQASLYKNYQAIDQMIAFAREVGVPFVELLERRRRFLESPIGWGINRLHIAGLSQVGKLGRKMRLWRYRAKKLLSTNETPI